MKHKLKLISKHGPFGNFYMCELCNKRFYSFKPTMIAVTRHLKNNPNWRTELRLKTGAKIHVILNKKTYIVNHVGKIKQRSFCEAHI